ncbi:MAG: DUF4091 domain-containing protein [Lentisphaerae bacterium]|nr:DUF4091 domain-containing protein [Lentisphaerota bacterium]
MKKLFCFSAVLCTLICAAEVKISDRNGNILANNGEISTYLLKKNNYSFNLSARDANGANFGAVIESILWYHGRSGNTEHIYQDQSEKNFLPGKYIINHRSIRTTSSNADFEIERITEFPENTGAVTYEYILTVKESRDHGKMRFPLTRLTKEITTVSFDDGTLENFTTSAKIPPEELAKTRSMLFHIPARGKTLLMLIDVNTPLKYGHRFGIMPTYSPGSWARSVNFHHLYMPDFPFYNAGEKLGFKFAFKILDGGSFSSSQKEQVKILAGKLNFLPAQYTPGLLDSEYRYPSALAAQLPGVGDVKIWSEIPLKRVYPAMESPKCKANSLYLTAAANERESIQVVLNSPAENKLEKIVFSDLVSSNGSVIPAVGFTANILGVQKTNAPLAQFYGETRFPDKLRPAADALPVKLKAKQNTIIHLTFFAPQGTAKGVYHGKITLTVGKKSCDIPVALRVWGFELPAVSRFTAHGLLWNSLPEHRDEVLKQLAQYGINGSIYPGGQKQLREIFDGRELRFKDDLAMAEKALKVYHQPMFQAPYLFLGAWNWKPGMKVQFLNLDLNTKEFEDKFSAYLSSLHRQVKAKNILDRTFIYMWDEMTGGHYDAMQKTVGMVRKYAPGIKLMTVSAPDPMVLKYNDIITTGPFGQWLGKESRAVVEKAIADGKEFWIYLNGITFSHQVSAAIPRMTAWLCFAHGFTGYLQWSMDYNWQYGTFEKNGDVWILYPAYDKPVYSARLEYFRDGVEDFNMMILAETLPQEIAAQIKSEVAKITPVMGKCDPDPVKMYEIRNRIGDILEKNLNKGN